MNPDAAPFKGPEVQTSVTNHNTFFQNRKKPAAQSAPSNGGGQKTGTVTGAKLSGKRGVKIKWKAKYKTEIECQFKAKRSRRNL